MTAFLAPALSGPGTRCAPISPPPGGAPFFHIAGPADVLLGIGATFAYDLPEGRQKHP